MIEASEIAMYAPYVTAPKTGGHRGVKDSS